MEAVNLLPAYARPGHPWAAIGRDLSARRVVKAGIVAACVVAVGLGAGYYLERTVVNNRQAAARATSRRRSPSSTPRPLRFARRRPQRLHEWLRPAARRRSALPGRH